MELSKSKKILVIDRLTFFSKMLTTILQEKDIEVETAQAADIALLKIVHDQPSLIITGVEIGNITGFDLCLIVRMIPHLVDVPIIIMSATDESDSTLRRAACVGADYYVTKNSQSAETLKEIIEEVFSKKQCLLNGALPLICNKDIKKQIENILIVDDSSTMRKIIKNILTGIGVQKILEAQDGVEALRKAEECHIDVILTDWNMPRMNGLEFVKNIRSRKELDNTRIIVITAEGAGKVEPALEAGANGFLYKPFNTNKLKEVLEGLTVK